MRRIAALSVLLLMAFMLLVDWKSAVDTAMSHDDRWSADSTAARATKCGPEVSTLLLREYDSAVKEIHSRIDQESLLFGFKFSLVGAILGLLFAGQVRGGDDNATGPWRLLTSPQAAAFCWAAVATSAIIDSRILYHQVITAALGTWIRTNVEPFFLAGNIRGWEGYIATEPLPIHHKMYPLLRFNVSLLTYALFAATSVAYGVIAPASQLHDRLLARVCAAGSVGCLIAFYFVGLQFHYWRDEWAPVCLLEVAIGVVAAVFFVWPPCSRPWNRTTKRAH